MLRCGISATRKWRPWRAFVLHRDDHEKVVSAGLGYRAEGTAWRLGRGKAAGEVGQNADELRGPDTLAAFYRRSALETVGGFSPWAADTLAGIDVALALGHAGFRCASEPRCVVRADDAAVREKPGFRHGRDAERLFWRWASAHGYWRSLAAHSALLVGECTIGLLRPLLILRLLGRAWGVIHALLGSRACGAGVPPAPSAESAAPEDLEPSIITVPRRTTVRSARSIARRGRREWPAMFAMLDLRAGFANPASEIARNQRPSSSIGSHVPMPGRPGVRPPRG